MSAVASPVAGTTSHTFAGVGGGRLIKKVGGGIKVTDDDFIEREYFEVDFDPIMLELCQALEAEDEVYPDEDSRTRSERLIAEATPAAYLEIIGLAIAAENPDVRQDAQDFLRRLHKERFDQQQEER